ncbi:alpha/beta hydrolase [Arthrobacter sp. PAMC25564]|uniref:alpha/beta hydrolase n=1 Tax=Arthrobacter sp. PAMC25564 TaxID=2565366 RepID=UPI0010A209F5|nr:alpha/beta hydrolase [Arthrobacter sp. PAMC25564]QCB97880.1 alpha/beta hydrolase [Arthrobacter sp. PAMC25564]
MALDEATTAFLTGMAQAAGPDAKPLWELTAAEARIASSGLKDLYGSGPDVHNAEDHTLTGYDGGNFKVRVLVPNDKPNAVLVYMHGGGWVLDDIEGYETLGRQLATKSGAVIVLVNYRKAPEHPFPTPVEDAWTALKWTGENVERFAGARVPLFVGGDSAGGNLAAVTAIRARDNAGPELAGQVLLYPSTDSDFSRASYLEPENQSFLTTEFMQWFWNLYLPEPALRIQPEASPLRTGSLAGLAPALVVTAEHDILRDEGEAYAARLEESGVNVEHHRWPGQMHAFFSMVNVLPASADVMNLVANSIRTRATDTARVAG